MLGNPPESSPTTLRRVPALLLLAGLIFLYTASATLRFRSDDEHILAARAQSLALWGDLGQTQVFGNTRVQELRAQGDAATELEPGQAILGAIAYRLARWLDVGGAQAFLLTNIYVTGLTALLILMTIRRLGFDLRVAFLAAMLYGVATAAWPYATTGYRDPLAAFAWSVALYGWSMILEPSSKAWLAWCVMGIGLVLAVIAKNTSFALVGPILLTAVVWLGRGARRSLIRSRYTLLVLLGAALSVITGLLLLPASGPLARYSLPYFVFLARHAVGGWDWGLLASFSGPFLSPAKSIFLFSPAALLGAAGVVRWEGDRKWFAIPVVASVLLLALLQALFYRQLWAGVFGWGLRFMLPTLPGFAVLSAPFLQSALRSGRRAAQAGLVALFILAVAIQASAILVPWLRPYQDWKALGLDPFRWEAAWSIRFLAIPIQLAHLRDVTIWEVVGARLALLGYRDAAVLQCALVLAAGAALAMGLRAANSQGRGSTLAASVVLALALVAPLGLLISAKEDPAWGGSHPEYIQASERLQQEAAPGDPILVESYGSPLWAYLLNRWFSPLPWYSLPYDIPGDESAWVDPWVEETVEAARTGHRVWLITSTQAPGSAASGPQAFLRQSLGSGSEWVFPGDDSTQVLAFP